MTRIDYDGSFDDISDEEIFAMGVKSKQNGDDDGDTNPANRFCWSTDDTVILDRIEKAFDNGWLYEHRRVIKINNDIRLVQFKIDMPELNANGFIEHDSNKGHYFACRAVFIGEENDALLIMYTDGDRIGKYALMGRGTHTMGTWHNVVPK